MLPPGIILPTQAHAKGFYKTAVKNYTRALQRVDRVAAPAGSSNGALAGALTGRQRTQVAKVLCNRAASWLMLIMPEGRDPGSTPQVGLPVYCILTAY